MRRCSVRRLTPSAWAVCPTFQRFRPKAAISMDRSTSDSRPEKSSADIGSSGSPVTSGAGSGSTSGVGSSSISFKVK